LITIPEELDSKYRFVIISALRARQIQGGSAPKVDYESSKPTQIAKREVLEGLVEFKISDLGKRRGK